MSLTTAEIIAGLESELRAARAAVDTIDEAWAKAKKTTDWLFERLMVARVKPFAIEAAIDALKPESLPPEKKE